MGIHELGHFWAAVSRGIHVTKFSIGFGPTLFKWQARARSAGSCGSCNRVPQPLGCCGVSQACPMCSCSGPQPVPFSASLQGKEVEYSLRALPLGGFVAFPDDDPESTYPGRRQLLGWGWVAGAWVGVGGGRGMLGGGQAARLRN